MEFSDSYAISEAQWQILASVFTFRSRGSKLSIRTANARRRKLPAVNHLAAARSEPHLSSWSHLVADRLRGESVGQVTVCVKAYYFSRSRSQGSSRSRRTSSPVSPG